MKRMKRMKLMAGIAVALLMGLPTLYGQSNNIVMPVPETTSVNGVVQVTIPFDFSVSGKTLAAGEYLIAPSGEKGIAFKGVKGNGAAVVLTHPISNSKADGPKLVFHRYGDKYFLAQAWLRYSDTGCELFASPDEIQMARAYRQQNVELVAAK